MVLRDLIEAWRNKDMEVIDNAPKELLEQLRQYLLNQKELYNQRLNQGNFFTEQHVVDKYNRQYPNKDRQIVVPYEEMTPIQMQNNGFIIESQGDVHVMQPEGIPHFLYMMRHYPESAKIHEHEYNAMREAVNGGLRARSNDSRFLVTFTVKPTEEQILAIEHIFKNLKAQNPQIKFEFDKLYSDESLVSGNPLHIRPAIEQIFENTRTAGFMDWLKPKHQQTEEFETENVGGFALPFELLTPEEKEVLRNYHEGEMTARFKPSDIGQKERFEPSMWGGSFILHPNGNLDEIPDMHYYYIGSLSDMAQDHVKRNVSRYFQGKGLGAYDIIHSLFDGGIRIFITGDEINITAHQFPTKSQFDMLDRMDAQVQFRMCYVTIHYKINGTNKTAAFEGDWTSVRSQIENYKQNLLNGNIPEKNRQLNDQINMFRNPNYGTKEQMPDWGARIPKMTLSPEQMAHLIQNIGPMSYRPEKSASTKIFKSAQTGKYAHPPFAVFSDQFLQKFMQHYNNGLVLKEISGDEIKKSVNAQRSDSSSWILHENGTFDLLPSHHGKYLKNVLDKTVSNLFGSLNTQDRDSMADLYWTAYKAIHTLFKGAMRVYLCGGSNITINSYQAPTSAQINALDEFAKAYNVGLISPEIDLKDRDEISGWKMPLNQFLNRLKQINLDANSPTKEDIQRHEIITKFRDPEYAETGPKRLTNEDIRRMRPAIEKRQLDQKEIEHLMQNLGPMSYKPEKSASTKIFKSAQSYDQAPPFFTPDSENLEKFKELYVKNLAAQGVDGNSLKLHKNNKIYSGSSWVLHKDGGFDLLPKHHGYYFEDIFDKLPESETSYGFWNTEINKSIHTLLDEAFRVFLFQDSGDIILNVNGYQKPTLPQIKALEDFCKIMRVDLVSAFIEFEEGEISIYEWSTESFINELKKIEDSQNEENRKRHEIITQFRNPEYEPRVPTRLTDMQAAQMINKDNSMSYKPEKSAAVKLLKIAQILDSLGMHKEVDEIL